MSRRTILRMRKCLAAPPADHACAYSAIIIIAESDHDIMAQMFSEEEVSRHNSPHDAWVILDGRVYDISGFLNAHPGGLEVVAGHLGTDVSDILRSPHYHLHSRAAYQILDRCCIGELNGANAGPQVGLKALTNDIELECIRV